MKDRLNFLCFLTKQASKEVCEIIAEKAFLLLYPLVEKAKDIRDCVEKQAFHMIYPIEETYRSLTEGDVLANRIQEKAFLLLYPVEKTFVEYKEFLHGQYVDGLRIADQLQENVQKEKQKLTEKISGKAQEIQSFLFVFRIKANGFAALSPPCNQMELRKLNIHLWYLHNFHFKEEHRLLERLYKQFYYTFMKCSDSICNRIVAYFAMLFGVFLHYARGTTLQC